MILRSECPIPRARAYLWLIAAAGIPLLLLLFVAWFDLESVLCEEEREVDQTTEAFYQHALNVFETHQLIADRVIEHTSVLAWDEIASSAELREYVMALQTEYPQVQGIWLIDASGVIRNGSRVLNDRPTNVAADDYFRALQNGYRGTFVGHMVNGGVIDGSIFNFAKRRESSSGKFDGAVVVTVLPSYFTDFWRKASPPLESVAGLVRSDGVILAREPAAVPNALSVAASSPIMEAIANGERGLFRGKSSVDGVDRLYAVRKIGQFDAFVAFGIANRAVLGMWHKHLAIDTIFSGPASFGLFLMAVAVLRWSRREQIATEHWRATAQLATQETDRRVAAEAQLQQSQKMEALGQFTGGIAHDFNNLVTIVIGNLEQLLARQTDEQQSTILSTALSAAERGEKSVEALLAFARRQSLEVRELNLSEVVTATKILIRQSIGMNVELVVKLDPDLWWIAADRNQFELALVNLTVNARDAMPAGGLLRITAENVRLTGDLDGLTGEFVKLSVCDTGTGMPQDTTKRIFEPFFTTKAPGKGTGLGLSQLYGFVKQSGGTVIVSTELGQGTCMALYFPRAINQKAAESSCAAKV